MSEVEMEPLDERETAYLEQEQIGIEALNRLHAKAPSAVEDLKYIAWMAGLTRWEPRA